MLITDELSNALNKLEDVCLLNVSRSISDFLRESAADEELCSYVEAKAHDVFFRDELIALARTKKFPTEPQRNLPFVFALLYYLDTGKLQPEDVITQVYPHMDVDDAATIFFSDLAKSLRFAIDIAVSESDGSESQTCESNNDEDVFELFISFINGLPKADFETYIHKTEEMKKAFDTDNISLMKSYYYALEDMLRNDNISVAILDGIKEAFADKGVVV